MTASRAPGRVASPRPTCTTSRPGLSEASDFVGPQWADADGSRVKARLTARVDAPIASERNVDWLKLEADEKVGGSKLFGQVSFIQRILTYGGKPPSSCSAADGDTTLTVPYTALYIFWQPK